MPSVLDMTFANRVTLCGILVARPFDQYLKLMRQ